MKITEARLRQIIREELESDQTGNSDDFLDDAPLGKYAFSPQRQSLPNPPPMEPNTRIETALRMSLQNHVRGIRPLTRRQAQLILSFINAGMYSDIIKGPPPGTYYRGMMLSLDSLKSLGIPVPHMDVFETQMLTGPFDVAPRGVTASWTSNLSLATDYALGYSVSGLGDEHIYTTIFFAEIDDNPGKFIDLSSLYDIIGKSFSVEKEVIGVGTIRVKSVSLMRYY